MGLAAACRDSGALLFPILIPLELGCCQGPLQVSAAHLQHDGALLYCIVADALMHQCVSCMAKLTPLAVSPRLPLQAAARAQLAPKSEAAKPAFKPAIKVIAKPKRPADGALGGAAAAAANKQPRLEAPAPPAPAAALLGLSAYGSDSGSSDNEKSNSQ